MADSAPSPPLASPTALNAPSTLYKGKVLRSWSQLPPEVVQLIATHYFLSIASTTYIPNTWDLRDNWPRRIVYTALRDALELERLMYICPAWANALETHMFWQHALAVIDPHDVYAAQRIQAPPPPTAGSNVGAAPTRLSPYRMFRNVTGSSCIVCRINFPYHNQGLASAKRLVQTPHLGTIAICRDHHHRKDAYCGLCLRESPPMEAESEYGTVCCYQNDDEDTWPGVTTTCRNCRMEALWARVTDRPADREALGGSKWRSSDWETRQTIESFLDLGEGTITDVVTLAREKFWLKRHTKLADMLQQALAAARYTTRAEAGEACYGTDEEMSEDDDEDDAEFLSATEDQGGIKEIAIADWARNRILDGFWISPADQWYNHTVAGHPWHVPARHPCPWNRDALYSGALEDGEGEAGEELEHPRPKTVRAEVPPSFHLCDQTYRAFLRSMRDTLLPAMTNLVRKIVIECAADGLDPTMRASRMTTEEVVQELRDESVWFNGIDWLERRANRAREDRDRMRNQPPRQTEEDDSSSSSRSDGSHTTSPVLSTTTLQTTPSPPPSGDSSNSPKEDDITSSPTATLPPQLPIPISPVLQSPQLIHPIPYIPVTIAGLPFYSIEALKQAWREACAPLYHCRCSVCERATLKANIESGAVVPSQAPPSSQPAPAPRTTEPPIMIHIQNPSSRVLPAAAEEEEEGEDDSILDSDDDFEDETDPEEMTKYLQGRQGSGLLVPATPPSGKAVQPLTPKKRPSQELESEGEDDVDEVTLMDIDRTRPDTVRGKHTGTPPKRARTEDGHSPTKVPPASSPVCFSPTPVKTQLLGKRPSEELDDDAVLLFAGNGDAKRMKFPSSQTGTPNVGHAADEHAILEIME